MELPGAELLASEDAIYILTIKLQKKVFVFAMESTLSQRKYQYTLEIQRKRRNI